MEAGTLAAGTASILCEGNLTVMAYGTLTAETATIDINGTLDASAGAVTFNGAANLLISGSFTGIGTFAAATSTITYDGGDQTIPALFYYTLLFAGSASGATKTFGDGITKVMTEIVIDDNITLTGSTTEGESSTVQVSSPYEWDGTSGNSSATESRVFNVDASGKTITIANMTVKGGDISALSSTSSYGGSIYLGDGTLTIDACIINGSKAAYGGGICLGGSGTLSISGSTMSDCTASGNGGCVFNSGTTTISGSIIGNSTAAASGGGFYNGSGTATITESTISGNSAGAYGGGFYNSANGTATITGCTINGNTGANGGGIGNAKTMALVNSTIYGNAGSTSGGGIYNSSSLNILDCTVAGNSGSSGAGIYSTGTMYSTNNIVAYNYLSDNSAYTDINNSGTVYGNYNISSYTGFSGTGNIEYIYTNGRGNALFASYTEILANTIYIPVLADNGGSTNTVAITSGSVALGSGAKTGSYDDSGTKYAFSVDGNTWYTVEDGTNVTTSVTQITTDQRGETITGPPAIGSYFEIFTPTTQASNVSFTNISMETTSISWTRGNGDNCAVFMAAASSGTASPVDANTYIASTTFSSGTQIGSTGWYCVYNGTGTSTDLRGLSAATTYRVHVCEYNKGAGSELYLTDAGSDNPDNVTTTWQPSDNNALDFDGTDDYVSISSLDMGDRSALTVETWVNPHTFNESGDNNISNLIRGGNENVILRIGDSGIANNQPQFVITIGSDQYKLDANTSLNANKWYHIAGVYDGSTIKLYINGKLDNSISRTGTIASSSEANILGGETGGHYLDGQMDEVRIWNVARTATEIRENMTRSVNGNASGLIASYRFNETSGTTLHDATANGSKGTLTNMDGSTDWVDSEAFNTWLGTTGSDWDIASNWSDGVPTSGDNVGIYKWGTNSETSISGTPTVENLVISSTSSPTLGSGITVNGNLILEKNMDLNGKTITLGSSGTLIEDAGIFSGTSGLITTTRDLNNISAENVGGLGAVITTSANMGSTTVSRGHSQAGGSLSGSILRQYNISPSSNTGLDATLVFNYLDNELNSLEESKLQLFKSSDSGTTWANQHGTVNTGTNIITLNNIDGFSLWTASINILPTASDFTSSSGPYQNAVYIFPHQILLIPTATATRSTMFGLLQSRVMGTYMSMPMMMTLTTAEKNYQITARSQKLIWMPAIFNTIQRPIPVRHHLHSMCTMVLITVLQPTQPH